MLKTVPTFQNFWDAYDLKRDRLRAERAWNRLSAADKKAAVMGIAPYREDCDRRGIARMYAQGYLNNRRWEDDFTADPQGSVSNGTAVAKPVAVSKTETPTGSVGRHSVSATTPPMLEWD